MKTNENIEFFNKNLSIKIDKILSIETCKELILKYEDLSINSSIAITSEKIIQECSQMVFLDELDDLLLKYFQADYEIMWSSFDIVEASDLKHNYSTRWHLDGGIKDTLKLFIYLNPVSEHEGNTIMIDKEKTIKLREAGKLPITMEEREEDITQSLEKLGLDTKELSYDLKTGDALLFSPLLLAHKCLPPKVGKKRYTICFTIVNKNYK